MSLLRLGYKILRFLPCLHTFFSMYLSFHHPSLYLSSVYLYIYLSIYPSIHHLSIFPSIIYLSSIYLPSFLFFFSFSSFFEFACLDKVSCCVVRCPMERTTRQGTEVSLWSTDSETLKSSVRQHMKN